MASWPSAASKTSIQLSSRTTASAPTTAARPVPTVMLASCGPSPATWLYWSWLKPSHASRNVASTARNGSPLVHSRPTCVHGWFTSSVSRRCPGRVPPWAWTTRWPRDGLPSAAGAGTGCPVTDAGILGRSSRIAQIRPSRTLRLFPDAEMGVLRGGQRPQGSCRTPYLHGSPCTDSGRGAGTDSQRAPRTGSIGVAAAGTGWSALAVPGLDLESFVQDDGSSRSRAPAQGQEKVFGPDDAAFVDLVLRIPWQQFDPGPEPGLVVALRPGRVFRVVDALAADVAALDDAGAAFFHHFPD